MAKSEYPVANGKLRPRTILVRLRVGSENAYCSETCCYLPLYHIMLLRTRVPEERERQTDGETEREGEREREKEAIKSITI